MNKLARAMKGLENALAATSFAEEGEFDTARSIMKEDRRVLLAVRRGQADRKTFRYAVNTCKRIGAHLDILYISPSGEMDPILEECLIEAKTEGIDYTLDRKCGCLKQEIIDYVNAKKGILFAVTPSSDTMDAACKGKGGRLSEAWRNLRCPLVVVADGV